MTKSRRHPDPGGNSRNEGGFTLIEVLTVVAVIAILCIVLGFSAQGWVARHKVEAETKQMFADVIEARARAMQRSRSTFVVLTGTGYSTYEDTNPAPDGDDALDPSNDNLIASRTTVYPLVETVTGGTGSFRFNREGISSASGLIRLTSTLNPDFDGIKIGPTRVKLGRYDGTDIREK